MNDPAAMFGFDPPSVSGEQVLAIARNHWGIAGTAQRLRGERSHNSRIAADDGRAWTLQIQSASEDRSAIDLQTRAMQHLESRTPDVPVPRVVTTLADEPHAEVELDGRIHLVRLVTFLPGAVFDPTEILPDRAHRAIGVIIGRIAAALDDFDHPSLGHFMPWDVANGLIVDDDLRSELTAPSTAALASVDDRLASIADAMPHLPHRVVHNDGHAGNLVRPDATSDQVSGVIDFGDLVRTVTAADVAIIAESFAPDDPDPARVVAAITEGYHRHVPLDEHELEAIPELVLARTALNVLLGEFQIRHAPHLADRAARMLEDTIDRMVRWSRLDVGAMIERIHRTITSDTSSDTSPGATRP
jgi:hydroxylysine kinase